MTSGVQIGMHVHLCHTNVSLLRVGVSTYVHVCGSLTMCVCLSVRLNG